jgi:hypothetical protein
MKRKLLTSCFMLILAVSCLDYRRVSASGIGSEPCVIGHTAAPTGFWTWPANSHVNIYLREPDFTPDYVSAIKIAVENWDAVAVETGSNVHFSFKGLTRETKTTKGDMTIIRGDVFEKKVKHLALLEAHSLRSDQLIDYALVIVDFRVKNPEVLTNVMAHEIGHSLGLLDCYACKGNTTAMRLLKAATETNGIEGPTPCDKMAVLAAYRELALHVRRAPTTKSEVDEGEEPEADNTPIIRPPE